MSTKGCIANVLPSLSEKEFLKSVKVKVTAKVWGLVFLEHGVVVQVVEEEKEEED